ncbi:MAG: MoaD/ThiS family protein [Terriglobales bacterium]
MSVAVDKKTVHVQYFAILREERGASEETITTGATTPKALYDDLREKHGFSLGAERMSVAINNEFATWESPLRDKDVIVFIPPVAGG